MPWPAAVVLVLWLLWLGHRINMLRRGYVALAKVIDRNNEILEGRIKETADAAAGGLRTSRTIEKTLASELSATNGEVAKHRTLIHALQRTARWGPAAADVESTATEIPGDPT
jgi:hypothetical protein